jgi:hypothetical protein
MSAQRKRRQPFDKYKRDLEGFIPRYVAATGDQAWNTSKVAEWAIHNGLWEQRSISAVKQLARELSRVARQVYITGDNGRRIRKYHAFRLGDHQPMLWAEMEAINPEQMKEAKTMRRNKLASGVIQLAHDLDHFNQKHNPGDPILFDPNFNADLEEASHSAEYEDNPPPDDDEDEESTEE